MTRVIDLSILRPVNRLYHHSLFINFINEECDVEWSLSWIRQPNRYACPGIEMSNRWFVQTITRRLLHLRPCETCWHNGKKGNLGLLRGVAFSWNEFGFLMTSRAVDSSGRVTLPCNRVSDTCALTFFRLFLSPSPLSTSLFSSTVIGILHSCFLANFRVYSWGCLLFC